MSKNLLIFAVVMAFHKPVIADAIYDYDVEWFKSLPKEGVHMLAITINNCRSIFKIKTEDLQRLSDDRHELKKLLRIAVRREQEGCK